MIRTLMSTAALAALAGTANAGFFSFASDSDDMAWTFIGGGANVGDGISALDPLVLMIADNNGDLPTLVVSVDFNAEFSLNHAGSVQLPDGDFSHNYALSGTFSFTEVTTGITILSASFEDQLFTALGGPLSWYTTAAAQGSDGGGFVDYTWNGASLPDYGLEPGPLGFDEDFGFTFTALNADGSLPWGGELPGVDLDPNTMLPANTWYSEGSYSGGASIPAAGTAAVLGLGGLIGLRRRR